MNKKIIDKDKLLTNNLSFKFKELSEINKKKEELEKKLFHLNQKLEKNNIKNNMIVTYVKDNERVLDAVFLESFIKDLIVEKEIILNNNKNLRDIIDLKKEISLIKKEQGVLLKENSNIRNIIDLKKEITRLSTENKELLENNSDIKKIINDVKTREAHLTEIKRIENKLISLKEEHDVLTDLIYLQDFGLYDDDVDLRKYSKESVILKVKEKQKNLLKSDNFYSTFIDYQVNNNIKQGQKLQKDNAKVAIRCFNEESKAIIRNATPENKTVRVKRLEKSFEIINKNLDSLGIKIVTPVLSTKKELLDIEITKYVNKQKEKELLREKKEEERERKIIEREVKKELEKIAKEEEHVRNELSRLKKEKMLEGKYREQIDKLNQQLLDLENQKEKVNENVFKGRAGYVYIIGNKGAFGEGVYKIGVTRRLDPFDRINELSNASVPFKFETHATIFSEDAFSLEKQLHNTFDSFKVNKVNNHKEFFKVPLEDIREEVLSIDNSVEFDMNEINYEYLQTLKIEEQLKTNTK